MKKLLLILLTFFLVSLNVFAQDEPTILPSQIGVIQNVEYVDINEGEVAQVKQTAEIKLKDGNLVLVDNMITGNPYYDLTLKKGEKVLLHVEDEGDGLVFSVEDIKRSGSLVWLSLIFCGLLIYVGKKKGLYSLVSIAISCLLITNVLSPMLLARINPILSTILICLLSTAITMYLVGGFNKKSTSATIGCVLSLMLAGLLSFIVTKTASLTGFNNENSMFLYSAHPELDFIGITISTMILATLGAVMDVGMSISSTINEIYTIDNSKTIKELFTSGMNVGRDIIGTMANTLILVYLGSSLPLVLLSSNIDLQKFVNLNQVVTEIASALIGSIAIVICVPITALVASNYIKSRNS
jgi:uncharacterized membrane protein